MMDTDALISAVAEFPRTHISFHGVPDVGTALEVVSNITGKKPDVSFNEKTIWVTASLESGSSFVAFVDR
jgi:hypothetical protein